MSLLTAYRRWRAADDVRVESHQQRLIEAGRMCPACRCLVEDSTFVGSSTYNGECGAVVDATAATGRPGVCGCRNLFHGH